MKGSAVVVFCVISLPSICYVCSFALTGHKELCGGASVMKYARGLCLVRECVAQPMCNKLRCQSLGHERHVSKCSPLPRMLLETHCLLKTFTPSSRWQSVDGNDETCRSCDISHRLEEPLPTDTPRTATVSKALPAVMHDYVRNTADHKPVNYIRIRPHMAQRPPNKPQPSSGVMKRGADHRAGEFSRVYYCLMFKSLIKPMFLNVKSRTL